MWKFDRRMSEQHLHRMEKQHPYQKMDYFIRTVHCARFQVHLGKEAEELLKTMLEVFFWEIWRVFRKCGLSVIEKENVQQNVNSVCLVYNFGEY